MSALEKRVLRLLAEKVALTTGVPYPVCLCRQWLATKTPWHRRLSGEYECDECAADPRGRVAEPLDVEWASAARLLNRYFARPRGAFVSRIATRSLTR